MFMQPKDVVFGTSEDFTVCQIIEFCGEGGGELRNLK